MNNEELISKILDIPSESRTLEFKRLGSRNEGLDRVLQSIVAMANTDGGILVIGVDDPQKTRLKGQDRIFGIEENIRLYDELGQAVRKISPPISGLWPPDLIDVKSKGIRIGWLSVPKVVDGFRSIESHVYIRQERGNKRLTPQEIIHFSYVKGFERADKELVDVDTNLLKTNYYDAWRRARKIEGECAIRVFQYRGNLETIKETLNLIGTPKTISGPAIKQISDAHEYVLNLLRVGIRVPSGFITTYQMPERAVKEAITNAVIHRDYYTKKDIEIKIFEDRIEIESPGLFPLNITPSNIGYERAHGYRNDLLVKHLREFPDPPNLDQNEGVRAMRQVMRGASLYPPIFYTYPYLQDAVRVILLNERAPGSWDKVSHYLNKNKYITNKETRNILNIGDTVKVSKFFNRWVKQGLLTKIVPRTGAKRNVRYRLPSADEKSLFTVDQRK